MQAAEGALFGAVQQRHRNPDIQIRGLGDIGVVNARTHFTKPDGSRGTGCYTDV